MITIFAMPKAFEGNIAIIQRNAIKSWKNLEPSIQIILYGNEKGIKELAEELNLDYIEYVQRNEFGTPLINKLFFHAQQIAKFEILCYINSDIILLNDFIKAINLIKNEKRQFLMVGERTDLIIPDQLIFDSNLENYLKTQAIRSGKKYSEWGIDYFIFSKGLWKKMPDFAVGRAGWDNWCLYGAYINGGILIDSSNLILAIHQSHEYSHLKGGQKEAWSGIEAQRNREYADGKIYSINYANYILKTDGLHYSFKNQINRYKNEIIMSLIRIRNNFSKKI